ncbi:MAG: dienelactone hydrolase family protein [Anaerolineae bacterium]|nr:dienelactone hydrolase family protein [Anaerolineae bacterium]
MTLTNTAAGPHHNEPILVVGEPLESAKAAMILVHGRGANATDILSLREHIGAAGFAYLAPQAADFTWYPQSFLAPIEQNEPFLTSALATIDGVVTLVKEAGISAEKIVLGGFSQGACLASEFVARNAQRFGGLFAFSGGLIGPPGTARAYAGSFEGMPAFFGCSDVDFHIPKDRVHESAATFERMGANVTTRIYPGMPHTIIKDETDFVRSMVQGVISK